MGEYYNCMNTTDSGKAACNAIKNKDGDRLCIFVAGIEGDDDETSGGGNDGEDNDGEEPNYNGGGAADYSSKDRCAGYDVCFEGVTPELCGALGPKGCAWNNGQCRSTDESGGYYGYHGGSYGGSSYSYGATSYGGGDGDGSNYGGYESYGGGGNYGRRGPCTQFETLSACNAQRNEHGRRFCDFRKHDNDVCGVVDVCNNFASDETKCKAKGCAYYGSQTDDRSV